GALVAELLRPLQEPRRRPGEDVVGAVFDQRAAQVLVGVVDVDVARACVICGTCNRASDLEVLDRAPDLDELARLDVGADAHRKLRVAIGALDPGHSGSCHTSSRRIGISAPSAVTPSTSSSGPPTMKSVCRVAMFMPSSGSPSKTVGIPNP